MVVDCSPIFPLKIITAKRHYHYHGITASYLPSPLYYREIFPIPAVITVATAVLPLSPLPCHLLVVRLWHQWSLIRYLLNVDHNIYVNQKSTWHTCTVNYNTQMTDDILAVSSAVFTPNSTKWRQPVHCSRTTMIELCTNTSAWQFQLLLLSHCM